MVKLGSSGQKEMSMGPLSVHPENPRYFADGAGRATYLTGANWGFEWQDDAWDALHTFDYTGYLDFLSEYNHNLIRLWVVEHTRSDLGPPEALAHPMPYRRSDVPGANDGGTKFDLDQWDESFFERLRERVVSAREQGIYVSVMLFQGVSLWDHKDRNSQFGHPFHPNNNINGVNGDLRGDGKLYGIHRLEDGEITRRQEAYVRKVVDTVNDLDNVLFEIANEDGHGSVAWQYHMIRLIKTHEAAKPLQHPVGMTARVPDGVDTQLFDSPADWISPRGDKLPTGERVYLVDPPATAGDKVIILDTDHFSPSTTDPQYPWRSFVRGYNTWIIEPDIIADLSPKSRYAPIRRALGDAQGYAQRLDLSATTPTDDRAHCSTGYLLRNPGLAYLAYQPEEGPFDVALEAGRYSYEWFAPEARRLVDSGQVETQGGSTSFRPPIDGPALLYLERA